jgi:hypothetical protein
MRALLLLVTLSSSSCVALLTPALGIAIGVPAHEEAVRVGRAREAAYREQLEVDAAVARQRYNASVRDAPEVVVVPAELTPPPLVTADPARRPLRRAR